jgi:Protein of unknown function (DUF1364)
MDSKPIRSRKVLNSARGQPCSARFPGICCGDNETTVWAHLNGHAFGKGMGIKAHDVLGFHACYACHQYYDVGHGTRALLDQVTLLECVIGAVTETYVRLIVAGILVVPLDAETASHDRPVKPRKPKDERTPIASRTEWPQGRKLQSRPMRAKQ